MRVIFSIRQRLFGGVILGSNESKKLYLDKVFGFYTPSKISEAELINALYMIAFQYKDLFDRTMYLEFRRNGIISLRNYFPIKGEEVISILNANWPGKINEHNV